MDKKILIQYIDLKREIRLYERKLKELQIRREQIVQDTVTSSAEHPYSPHQVTIIGVDEERRKRRFSSIDRTESQLEAMKDYVLDLECEAYQYIQTIPDSQIRQAIIYKYMDNWTWEKIGKEMFVHRTTISDKVKNFLEEKESSQSS